MEEQSKQTPQVIDIVRNVPLTSLTSATNLPSDLASKVDAIVSLGARTVDIASVLTDDGYSVVLMPSDDDEGWVPTTAPEVNDEPPAPAEHTEVQFPEPDWNGDDEYADADDEEYDDTQSYPQQRVGLLGRFRSVFGKGLSFEQENAAIARNRKRIAARAPHAFERAVWTTRKGVLRCRICGGPAPEEGTICNGVVGKMAHEMHAYDYEHEHDHGADIGDLTVRSAMLAASIDEIVETAGYFTADEAHYMEPSPFADDNLACANCVAYCPETAGCYWVEGAIMPEGICRLWVIPERTRLLGPELPDEELDVEMSFMKDIVETDEGYCVTSADGSRSFGCYATLPEAEQRLAEIERFKKAEMYTPPKGVQEEAQRAVRWIEEGYAGDNFTPVGRRRASDLAAGRAVSLDIIQRMSSYLARHAVDKQGQGWSPGEDNYPSAGRVAWAAWGGDPAISWTRSILDSVEKSPTVSEVHVDVPMGSSTRRTRRQPTPPVISKAEDVRVGSFVSWGSSGGTARGKITRIVTEGKLNIPDSTFTVNGSEDDPAVLINVWRRTSQGWMATDQSVGHKVSTLTVIDPLDKTAGVFMKSEERRYTLGPWYVPDSYDAHGEWTDSEQLQQALWDYVRNSDRQIRLQHNLDVVAGEWVEALTWPMPVVVPMSDADGKVTDHEFPAGTVYMGVVWEPWAWDLVRQGKIRGYSIGGRGERVMIDLETEEGVL